MNGEKLWCTNGLKAGVLVVMAQTPPKMVNGKERKQITAFIVEVNTPGLAMPHRCHFMGLRALYNGVVTFKDVRVPRENIIAGEGKGLKVALTTLNTGRLTIPAACVGLCKRLLEVSRKWASERVQWGVPIGQHYAIAGKIAEMAGNTFAMEAITFLTSALVDKKAGDLRIETAMCKMWSTEMTWKIADDAMQVRGGRGYETEQSLRERGDEPTAVERFLRDCRINMIFEGSSEIMRLFIAREALDPHLKVGGAIFNTTLPMSTRMKSMFGSGSFYSRWYPRQYMKSNAGDLSKLHEQSAAACGIRRGHEQETRARPLSRDDAFRSETRSRATPALALRRRRHGNLRHERDLLLRAAFDQQRQAGRRNSLGRELLLPFGEGSHRSSLCRHGEECGRARLRARPGVVRRKARRIALRHRVTTFSASFPETAHGPG